ncbi:MAG TPA: hypothetical protein P5567_07955 [Kiritimatiellia bacterium]|nr:hypothetical protein [Kiritimatiellia bacterium]HRZ12373.1 hypothetical protein [Kiritimatiellia bacterium]HSA17869.1 hypothetical protein [Kiritimatiellia bacterium]
MKRWILLRWLCAATAALLCSCATPPQATPEEEEEAEIAEAVRQAKLTSQLPRVMLLVDEQSLGTIPTAEVEAMAIDMLLEENVQVVDQDMVQSNLGKGQEVMKMAGDNRGAAALGLQFGADLVVIGEVVAKPSARRISDTNLRSYQAAATLRAVRTDNSATIASASEDATVIGLDDVSGSAKAIKTAGKKSLDRLVPEMLDAWTRTGGRQQGKLNHVTVTVGGVDQMWKLKAIREQLIDLKKQTANVVQRNYTAGVAVFELDSLVPIEELSETIVLKPPEDIKFQVLEVGSGQINLKVAE